MNRRGQRRTANVTVRFITRPTVTGVGFVTNVSATGAFMETRFPLPLLSLIYLEPVDPILTNTARKRLAATVVRIAPSGVGLAWYEFSAETTAVYARLAEGAKDRVDPHQLPLPAVPDATAAAQPRVPYRLSNGNPT